MKDPKEESTDLKIERQKFQLHKKGYEDITGAIKSLKDEKKPEVQKVELIAPDEENELATTFFSMLKGKPGKDGETPSDDRLKTLIKPLIPKPIPGEKGDKGKDGDNYILKDSDKSEIASKIKVPIVTKVVEKTEVIKEIPIVKEVAIYESAQEIASKLATLKSDWLPIESVKGDFNTRVSRQTQRLGGSANSLRQLTDVVLTGLSQDANGNYILGSGSGGGGTPGGSSGDIQWNNGGSFDGFGSFNGTNQLDLSGISLISAGVTTTGLFNQSGDQASFDVAGSNFSVKTTAYSGWGLIYADNTGLTTLGDYFGDGNSTSIAIDDGGETITHSAVNGHFFTGQVATGAGISSVAGSANVPLTVTETINGYVGLQVQNLSNGTTGSSDFVVANDIDDGTLATGHYADFGIGSSTNTDPLFPALNGANNAYLYVVGGNLSLGTATANKSINFFTGGLEYSNRRMVITSTGSTGFGTIAPNNFMSIAPVRYLVGTASQSGTTVTGVGTTWTSAMVGNLFEFDNGTSAGTITGFTSATSITVSVSQTVTSQTYSIHYPGIEVSSTGAVGLGTTTPTAKLDVVTDGLGTTSPDISGIVLSNTTPSTSGVTRQFSPVLRFRGSAWKTDATAASQTIDFKQYLSTASGTSAPSGDMVWTASINGGTYVSLMGISSAGALTLYQGLPRTLDINASSSSIVGFRIFNTNNASVSAHARYEMTAGGASGGDPYTAYTINGVTSWSVGIDNSDSDTFKISESAGLGTNDRFILRTGGLTSVRVGLSTKQATLGGSIKKYFTSVGNVTTGEDDLFTYTTEANIFGTNGDNIEGEYSGTTAANANNKTFKFYFAGTNLLNSGALALNDKNWKFTFTIIRVSSTVVRYSVEFDYEGNTATILEVGELTGLTLSGTNILKITGEATSTDDIVATMGTVKANPASV